MGMEDNTSVEIQSAKIFQPSAGARSEGVVNESRPEDREGEEFGKLDPPGIGSDDERRRYGRKHTLIDYEGVVRHRCRIVGVGLVADIPKAQPVEPADDPLAGVGAKCQGVTEKNPLKRNDT